MATRTSIGSGDWGTAGTWDTGVPANGDTVIISAGHNVRFNVDESGFANGLASLTINGILHFKNDSATCLKMNGNITGTGKLIVATWMEVDKTVYSLVDGMSNARYLSYQNWGITPYIISSFTEFTEVDSIAEVEATPNSVFRDEDTEHPGYCIMYFNCQDANVGLAKPILRPTAGTEYRTYILFNSTGTINVPTIRMYGWYPELEYTTLSANADTGQADIVLTEDLGLQQGDKISVSSGTEIYSIAETVRGIYTVQSYDVGTKIITLTANLQTNRLSGDVVRIINYPIKVSRSTGTAYLISRNITESLPNKVIKAEGVFFDVKLFTQTGLPTTTEQLNYYDTFWFSHCSFGNTTIIGATRYAYWENCLFTSITSTYQYITNIIGGADIKDSVLINTTGIFGPGITIDNCIIRNCMFPGAATQDDRMFVVDSDIQMTTPNYGSSIYKNCKIKLNTVLMATTYLSKNEFINCELETDEDTFYILFTHGRMFNCTFNKEIEINSRNYVKNTILESFDHNQIAGNYKAWCKGGTIETKYVGEDIQLGKLIFKPEDADYPVFRDFNVTVTNNKINEFKVPAKKTSSDQIVKLELIDPSSDPLVDNEAVALATSTLTEVDEWKVLSINYPSTNIKNLKLRISAIGESGEVYVDCNSCFAIKTGNF